MIKNTLEDELARTRIEGKYHIASQVISSVIKAAAVIIAAVIGFYAARVTAVPQEDTEADGRITALEQQLTGLREEVAALETDRDGLQNQNEDMQKEKL